MKEALLGSKMMKAALMLLFMFAGSAAWSQQVVTGKVVDDTGEVIPGVNVLVEGTNVGTATDADGKFSISAPSAESVLIFSFIGFNTQRVVVGTRSTIDIELAPDLKTLEEVVVVGYGSQKKRDVTGSIVSVNAESIKQRQPVSVFDAIQGLAPGVQINMESRPGGDASIRIRGTGTLQGGQDPLYVVDGVPMDNITGINPNDVQSIEVLKDAASAAIYGSRSANGVIIITTKRGEGGTPKIDVRYNTMLSTLSHKLPQATADDRRFYDQSATGDPAGLNADSLNPSYNADNDLQDMLTRTAKRQQVDLGISGADGKLSYYANLGYLGDQGIIINSWANTVRGRLNLDYKASERFTFGNRIQFSYTEENRINEGNVLKQALQRPPTFRIYLPDGTFAGNLGGRKNPVAEALFYKNEYTKYSTNLYNYLSFKFTDYLKFTADFNYRFEPQERTEFSPKLLSNDGLQNSGGVYSSIDTYWMQQNYLNFDKTFAGDHTVNAVVGVSAEKWVEKDMQMEGTTYAHESILTGNGIGEKRLQDVFSTEARHTMVGMFGRLGYSYKGRYIANFNIRRDGSSRFGSSNRWGVFPSASLGWRFTDESFMSWTQSVLDDGKFRVSYGETGNERIPNYASLPLYDVGSNYYNGVLGIVPSSTMGNNKLSWETMKAFNAGVDLTFIENRVSFTADYYVKTTSDLLYEAPLPSEIGYTDVQVNVGTMENRGFEFMINTFPVRNGNVTWNLSYNMSFNKSKVMELYDGIPVSAGSNGRWLIEEGKELGNFFGYRNMGVYSYNESNAYSADWELLDLVFAEDGSIARDVNGKPMYTLNGQPYTETPQQMRHQTGIAQGGDVIWYDKNKDGRTDDADRVVLGNAQPKFIAGLTNTINYKNFTLTFTLYTQWGNEVYNKGRYDQSTFNGSNLTPDKFIIRSMWWKPGDVTNVPRRSGTSTSGNMRELNSLFVEDGSFIRLRSANLTYRLPASLTEKVRLKGASVYIYGNNLLTWTNYMWFDPEIPMGNPLTMGEDNGKYPRSRQIGLGVNLNF